MKTIIETHGGTIEFESEPDVGTRIACLLPAACTTGTEPADRTEPAGQINDEKRDRP